MKKILIALVVCGGFFAAMPVLAADGTLRGTITHASDDTPVESMTVYATRVSTGVVEYDTTAADGTYSMTVAPGTYDVTTYTYSAVEVGIYFIQKNYTVTVSSGGTTARNFSLIRRGQFAGYVYESDGVTRIEGATVYMTHASGYTSGYGYALTLSNGHYTATPTPNDSTDSAVGTYTINVAKAGYFGATVTNVNLTGNDRTITKNIKLTPSSRVTGVVRDSSNRRIADATVTLTKSYGQSYSALTNSTGNYTISVFDLNSNNGTAVGDYTLTVTKSGYVQKTADVSITADDSLVSGKHFVLAKAGKITGTVKKTSGARLAGAALTAYDGRGHYYYATSGSNGTYSLANLRPAPSYTVTAEKTYYVGQKVYSVAVTASHTTTGVNFTMPAAKTFSGTVKSATGAVLEGAVVSLYKRNSSRSDVANFSATTKGSGTFSFRNISPGKYRLKITLAGYVPYQNESIDLGSNVTGARYELALGGSISGRVLNGTKGVGGVLISVYAPANNQEIPYTFAVADENGRYLVTGLKTATYRLQIFTTEYVAASGTVNVRAGQLSRKNISLTRGGSVSGYLTDRVTGLPVSALVKVVGTAVSAWSDANGRFVLDGIAGGTCRVVVVSPYYDIPGQRTVTVRVGGITKNINFILNPKQ